MSDQFEGWTKLLALAQTHKTKTALRAAIIDGKLQIIETEPLSGYYRCAAVKDGPLLPVAIWRDGGTLYITRSGEPVALDRVWPYSAWTPVPFEWYEAVVERGEKWPDAAEPVQELPPVNQIAVVGETAAPVEDEAVTFRKKIEAAKLIAEKLYKVVSSDDEAAAAQSARSDLNTLSSQADKHRKFLMHPHEEKANAIHRVWMPMVKAAKASADEIRDALKVWENVKLVAEQKAAREAAQAAVAAVQPTAIVPTGTEGRVVTTSHNEAPPAEDFTPSPVATFTPPPAASHIKGATGRAASVFLVNAITITVQDAAYQHVKAIPEIKATILKIAQRLVDAGQTVPGVQVERKRDVA